MDGPARSRVSSKCASADDGAAGHGRLRCAYTSTIPGTVRNSIVAGACHIPSGDDAVGSVAART